jgi:hypothetical protein
LGEDSLAYTKEEIKEMLEDGEITKEQAIKLQAEINRAFLIRNRPVKQVEPLDVLTEELKNLSAQVGSVIQNQGDATIAISKFIPGMIETYKAIMNVKSEEKNHATEWQIDGKRNSRGLIEFPLKIKVVKLEEKTPVTEWQIDTKRDSRGLIEFPLKVKVVK